jgi:hypothetical protein
MSMCDLSKLIFPTFFEEDMELIFFASHMFKP